MAGCTSVKALRQLRNVGTIRQHHSAVEQREVHVPRGHMGKWQKRYAHLIVFSEVKCLHRTRDVRRHVPVGQHRSLRSSGRARGVNNCCQVVGPNRPRAGIELRIEVGRPLQHQFLHLDGVRTFDWVHHQNPLHRRLLLNGQHLFQLVLRGHSDDARPGIVEDEGSLLRRLRGINRNRDRAQGKHREIGDRPLRAIFAEDGDAIAFANSPGFKRASDAHDAAVNLRGRDRRPAQGSSLQHDAIAAVAADRK